MCFHGWRVQYSTYGAESLSSRRTEPSAASRCVRGGRAGSKTRWPSPTAIVEACKLEHAEGGRTPSHAETSIVGGDGGDAGARGVGWERK
eukprot:scaffold318862_cov35-Tisochrysis_lutea.AAC.3